MSVHYKSGSLSAARVSLLRNRSRSPPHSGPQWAHRLSMNAYVHYSRLEIYVSQFMCFSHYNSLEPLKCTRIECGTAAASARFFSALQTVARRAFGGGKEAALQSCSRPRLGFTALLLLLLFGAAAAATGEREREKVIQRERMLPGGDQEGPPARDVPTVLVGEAFVLLSNTCPHCSHLVLQFLAIPIVF